MKRIAALFAALAFLLCGCASGEPPLDPSPGPAPEDPGYTIRALTPKFDILQPFQNGYAFAVEEDRCGYLDKTGAVRFLYSFPEGSREIFLQCLMDGGLYNQLPASEEGLVPVCGEDGLWGYYDLNKNEQVIPGKYLTGVPFSQGRAAVCWEDENGTTQYGVIDTTGELVFSVDQISGGVYKNGLLAVQLPEEDLAAVNRWALVDRNGAPVVENYGAGITSQVTIYGYPHVSGSDFESTLDPDHIVLYRQSPDPKRAGAAYTVVDRKGAVQFADDSLSFLSGFSEGYAFYQEDTENLCLGVIDGTGTRLSGQVLDNAASFMDGVCWFWEEGTGYGFVDTAGKVLTPARYDNVSGVPKNGRASVEKEGRWGLVSLTGEELLPFQYDYLYSDGGELLLFAQEEKYGLLDLDGTVVVEPEYDGLGALEEGTALTVSEGKFGFLTVEKVPKE